MTEQRQLTFIPPFDWDSMLAFLQTRGSAGVEAVEHGIYRRTVLLEGVSGWLSVQMDAKGAALSMEMSSSLLPKAPQVVARLEGLFDLKADPSAIEKGLGALAKDYPGLRVPGAFDAFETVIRAILGQQISVKAASNLAGKVAEKFGGKIDTPFPKLTLLTPQPAALAAATEADLTKLGVMAPRARTIISFANEYLKGNLDLSPGAHYETTVAALIKLPGIGQWTADYVAMRCLGHPDAFMHGDLGIKKALGETNKKALIALAERYRPWRAYAAMHLWKSLET